MFYSTSPALFRYSVSAIDEAHYLIDLSLVDRVIRRRVDDYPAAVPDLVAGRLFERLDLLKTNPHRVLDLGAGDTRHRESLQHRFKQSMVFSADLSDTLLRRGRTGGFWRRKPPMVCLDASHLPFADGSFDLVVSNLMLPWVHPPDSFAAELNRVLSPQGVFFFSTAGPDTLMELRRAWSQIDDLPHVNALLDMHDVGDMLMRAGITDPVIDVERLQINYSSVDRLLDELVAVGSLNVLRGRRRGLMGSDIRQRLSQHYPLNDQGGVTATLEVVYAHGWKGQRKSSPRDGGGHEVWVSLDMLKRRKN
ncbi:MAG: methyltransferase domain-containing protein [Pseudomonadota bacterium]